jgi:peptide methionine sulfoxide reductase MsrA
MYTPVAKSKVKLLITQIQSAGELQFYKAESKHQRYLQKIHLVIVIINYTINDVLIFSIQTK